MANDTNGQHLEEFKLYRYTPNLAANVIFVVLFALAAIGHIIVLVRRKTWYFIPFVIGCLFEAVGYVGRVIAANETPNYTLGPYIIQSLLILLAPALFAASIYMILARLIRLLGAEEYAIVRTTWMTKVFVTGDVLSFLTQSAGGGLMAKAKTADDMKMSEDIVLGGLGIQIVFFGFFIITTVIFHTRIAKNPTPRSYSVSGPWKAHIMALYAGSLLILVRSLFRMAEFGLGNDGVLMLSEAYLLGLDGALMFIATAVFLWSHPSRVLGRGDKELTALASVESGRNTAESYQMLAVHPDAGAVGAKAPLQYDSDQMGAARGARGYSGGYDVPPSSGHEYSNSYGR